MKKPVMFGLENCFNLPSAWSRGLCNTIPLLENIDQREQDCLEILQSAVTLYRNMVAGILAGCYPTKSDKQLLLILGRVIYFLRIKPATLTEDQLGTCALFSADYNSLSETLGNLKEIPKFLLTPQATASANKLYTHTVKNAHAFVRESIIALFENRDMKASTAWQSLPQSIKRKWYVMKAELAEGYMLNTIKRHEQLFTYDFLRTASAAVLSQKGIIQFLARYEDFIHTEETAVNKKETLSNVALVSNAIGAYLDAQEIAHVIPFSARADKSGSVYVDILTNRINIPKDLLVGLRAFADEFSEEHDIVIFISTRA